MLSFFLSNLKPGSIYLSIYLFVYILFIFVFYLLYAESFRGAMSRLSRWCLCSASLAVSGGEGVGGKDLGIFVKGARGTSIDGCWLKDYEGLRYHEM